MSRIHSNETSQSVLKPIASSKGPFNPLQTFLLGLDSHSFNERFHQRNRILSVRLHVCTRRGQQHNDDERGIERRSLSSQGVTLRDPALPPSFSRSLAIPSQISSPNSSQTMGRLRRVLLSQSYVRCIYDLRTCLSTEPISHTFIQSNPHSVY